MRDQENRRHFRRFPLHLSGCGTFLSSSASREESVFVKDIGAGGAYLWAEELRKDMAQADLTFKWPVDKRQAIKISVTGKVMRSESQGDFYGIAVQFDQPPRYESTRDLSDEGQVRIPSLFRTRETNASAFSHFAPLRRVRDFVGQHYSQKITLAQSARIAILERTYFSVFFHQKVGIPFSTWLRQYRIERAIELMEKGNFSITAVAEFVGYSDLRTFERAFKRCTDITPRMFKKMVSPFSSPVRSWSHLDFM